MPTYGNHALARQLTFASGTLPLATGASGVFLMSLFHMSIEDYVVLPCPY